MATMVLSTGCSNDEVVEDFSPENAIEFGTYLGRSAEGRGSVITTEGNTENGELALTSGFGVFAYYTGTTNFETWSQGDNVTPNFMYNQKVTGKSVDGKVTWSYSPVKYWPNNVGDKVTFLAYAPYYENKEITGTKLTFNISNTNIKGQEDILYLCQNAPTSEAAEEGEEEATSTSCTANHKTIDLTKQKVDEVVNFHFLHALSRIAFNAEVMADYVNGDSTGKDDDDTTTSNGDLASETKITIEEIELIGKFYAQGTLDLNGGSWTPVASTNDYNFKLVSGDSGNLQNYEFDGAADEGDNVEEDADVSKRQVNLADSYLMIIPQEFKASGEELAEGEGIKIRVKYTVVTTDSNNEKNSSTVTNDITSDEFAFNFEQGKAYSFNLHLGMTSVKLTATVEGWGDEEVIAVNVPINSKDNN